MKATVNGAEHDFDDGVTVRELLAELGFDRPGVAAAVNGAVVPRTRWATSVVPADARVEVLTAVQGG